MDGRKVLRGQSDSQIMLSSPGEKIYEKTYDKIYRLLNVLPFRVKLYIFRQISLLPSNSGIRMRVMRIYRPELQVKEEEEEEEEEAITAEVFSGKAQSLKVIGGNGQRSGSNRAGSSHYPRNRI